MSPFPPEAFRAIPEHVAYTNERIDRFLTSEPPIYGASTLVIASLDVEEKKGFFEALGFDSINNTTGLPDFDTHQIYESYNENGKSRQVRIIASQKPDIYIYQWRDGNRAGYETQKWATVVYRLGRSINTQYRSTV